MRRVNKNKWHCREEYNVDVYSLSVAWFSIRRTNASSFVIDNIILPTRISSAVYYSLNVPLTYYQGLREIRRSRYLEDVLVKMTGNN